MLLDSPFESDIRVEKEAAARLDFSWNKEVQVLLDPYARLA